jgi:hypothetical protein
MKEGTQRIGAKNTSRKGEVVKVTRPEVLAECLSLCGGNESAAVALFCRGLDIWRQDRVARPMFVEGATVSEMEAAILAAVPGTTKGRGRPAKVREVEIPKTRDGSISRELLETILQKAGVKVVVK